MLFFQFNAVNIAPFPIQRSQRPYFTGSMLSTPLLFQLNAVNAAIFLFNAANAATFPVPRR